MELIVEDEDQDNEESGDEDNQEETRDESHHEDQEHEDEESKEAEEGMLDIRSFIVVLHQSPEQIVCSDESDEEDDDEAFSGRDNAPNLVCYHWYFLFLRFQNSLVIESVRRMIWREN